jgi:hypothetical protein
MEVPSNCPPADLGPTPLCSNVHGSAAPPSLAGHYSNLFLCKLWDDDEAFQGRPISNTAMLSLLQQDTL